MRALRCHPDEPASAEFSAPRERCACDGFWDLAALRRDWAFPVPLGDVLGRFLAHAAVRLAEFRLESECRDFPALQAGAHGLKGSAGMLRAAPLGAILGRIEALAASGSVSGLPGLLAELEQELARCRAMVDAEFGAAESHAGGEPCAS